MKKILKIIGIIIGSIVGIVLIAIGIASVYDLYLTGYFTTNKFPNVIVDKNIKSKNISEFTFPVGYEKFSNDENLNFLLNRTYSMAYARKADMELLGKRITDRSQWKSEMIKIAEEALAENRILNAALYYRIAEFYTSWEDPDKNRLYNLFVVNFYSAINKDNIEIARIPYEGHSLPALKVVPENKEIKGTIILHGGYDGFKEEFYSMMKFFSTQGYVVINFECPWMMRGKDKSSIPFTYEWESIISSIIDYYELEDVTLFGLSFGGWLCLRAAAFEPRITRVIASSVSFDVNQYPNILMQFITSIMMKNREMINNMLLKSMKEDIQQDFFFNHLMHLSHTKTPYDAALVLSQINEKNLHSGKITQDVLILTGKDDALVPYKMHNMQVKALVNAKSVTPMVFKKDSHGQNHCQVGNIGLALTVALDWIEAKSKSF